MHPLILIVLGILPAIFLVSLFWPGGGLIRRWRCRRRSLKVLVEDALKVTLTAEMDGQRLRTDNILEALGCRENKFTEVLDFLKHNQLAVLEGGELQLTEAGREYATFMVRAHRLYEHYLAEKTGYAEQEWHEQAEWYEHRLTEADVRSMAAELHFPPRDPHGDPIPAPRGAISDVPAGTGWKVLQDIAPGTLVVLEHIEDQPAEIYRTLLDEGFYPGMVFRLLVCSEDEVVLEAAGLRKHLPRTHAAQLSVSPAPDSAIIAEVGGTPLSSLKPGEEGVVLRLMPQIRGVERRRLMDFGLLPGTAVHVEMRSPAGDPTAYRIRGSLLALRENQTRYIQVTAEGKDGSDGA